MDQKSLKQALAARLTQDFRRRDFLRTMGAGAMLGAGAMAGGGAFVREAFAAEPPKRGGTLTWAQTVPPDTLDPHFTGSLAAIKIHNNIFNGLLKVAYDGKTVTFVPDLAESWEMTDGMTHIFKLRAGVKFHNGDVCDAEAVKWSIERVKDPKPARRMPGWCLRSPVSTSSTR